MITLITLTRTNKPEAKPYLFSIERDGETSVSLSRTEAIARLTTFEVEGAQQLMDQAADYGVIIIHVHG